ncbi:MAG: hypothetical protein Q4F40_07890, partial [Akkermansia sp.]|nr:hypothetical protein [Akkermansia sp.]
REALKDAAKSCEECRRRLEQLPPPHTHPAAIEANREALKDAAKSCEECRRRLDSLNKKPNPNPNPGKCQFCKGEPFPVKSNYRVSLRLWEQGVKHGCKNCRNNLNTFKIRVRE